MAYRRSIHDTTKYAKRLVDELKFTPSRTGLSAGVDEFFLMDPGQYPWNDSHVGCLPMISGGGKVLTRLRIEPDRVQVDFSIVEGDPGGGSMQRRAECILNEAVIRHSLRPYQAKLRDFGRNGSSSGWTPYATENAWAYPGRRVIVLSFWYNLSEIPKELTIQQRLQRNP